MPGIGGLDTAYDVNETTDTSNISSSLTKFALSIGSALATVGISSLARGTGNQAIATGIPSNPVVVIPGGQAATQQSLALASATSSLGSMLPILIFGAIVLGGIFAIGALRK